LTLPDPTKLYTKMTLQHIHLFRAHQSARTRDQEFCQDRT
jgi:hypothetical protein